MTEEIRQAVDELGNAVEELKTENRKRLDEIEKKRSCRSYSAR